MKNLNKHRKAITEAGYTLSKDGTQVTNKEGKTVAGTNDSGFFSGSKVLTNIFRGDKKAKAEPKRTTARSGGTPKTPPKTSKRPPRKSAAAPKVTTNKLSDTRGGRGDGIQEMARRAIDSAPSRSMTKEQARKYTSASPSGTPTLMSQGGNNAETQNTKNRVDTGEKNIFRNAKGEDISKGGWGRLFSRQDGGAKKTTDKDKDVKKVTASDKGMGTINDVTFAQYENMSQAERRAKDLPLKLNKRSWETRVIMESKK
jgi:hypothetical protein